jgi:hypothetical protein
MYCTPLCLLLPKTCWSYVSLQILQWLAHYLHELIASVESRGASEPCLEPLIFLCIMTWTYMINKVKIWFADDRSFFLGWPWADLWLGNLALLQYSSSLTITDYPSIFNSVMISTVPSHIHLGLTLWTACHGPNLYQIISKVLLQCRMFVLKN